MDRILLGHGSGGRLMHGLIEEYFVPVFGLTNLDDASVLEPIKSGRMAFTTDSYVVDPIFFPGGNIGELAINGTVNDLAMVGARPLYLTVGFIIEEGFEIKDLIIILESMKKSALEAGVRITAGDTKVVNRGKADKIFINTSGIGVIDDGLDISGRNLKPGMKIIISGSIGNHGIAVIAEREGFSFEPPVLSDTRPLNKLTGQMIAYSKDIYAMRDPTRGGLATTLKEFAISSGVGIFIQEEDIPVMPGVRGACDILGFDPLYVANEGILIACVGADIADGLVEVMKKNPYAKDSRIIGEVTESSKGMVIIETSIGGKRIVDMLSGEQLPRIC